jgi:CRISPR/Cas system CSM-associated protein Csm3 (group 7 of RAMP superfamily)
MTERKRSHIHGKIYFCGSLLFKNSFVSVSSGQENVFTDSLVCRDSNDRLIIPATSFAGVLRDRLERLYNTATDEFELDWLFGNTRQPNQEDQKCSDIVFYDLSADKENDTAVQQGVRMNRKYLAAEDKGKFDREIVLNERFNFFFYIEKTTDDKKFYQKWLKRLAAIVTAKDVFFVGGRNSVGNGWGVFDEVKYCDYDFTVPANLEAFLTRKGSEQDFITAYMNKEHHPLPQTTSAPSDEYWIKIGYSMEFKDAFLINDPESDVSDETADFNFLKWNNRFILPGSSVKGVFRNRSEMIANTIDIPLKIINEVFGFADADSKKKKQKSRILFSYAFPIPQENIIPGKLLTSVSIDRFTGGAAEAALFDFNVLMNSMFKGRIILKLNEENIWCLGLLYLLFRDIQEGDLSFGFGRTKGWGQARKFDYKIIYKNIHDKWQRYFTDEQFNIDELDVLYTDFLKKGA